MPGFFQWPDALTAEPDPHIQILPAWSDLVGIFIHELRHGEEAASLEFAERQLRLMAEHADRWLLLPTRRRQLIGR